MGEHRMFSNKITESDDFLDLPVTAQNLYFHLNMNADDRGFISNPRAVMRMCGASNGDAQVLLQNKFLFGFDGTSVILVKHWKIHNYIRKDRFHESNYVNLLKDIYFDENNGYTTNIEHKNTPVLSTNCQPTVNHVPTMCQPNDNQLSTTCHTEDKLSKDKLSKDKLSYSSERKDKKESDNPFDLPEEYRTGDYLIDKDIAAYIEEHGVEALNEPKQEKQTNDFDQEDFLRRMANG